jgi:hypothetical protein
MDFALGVVFVSLTAGGPIHSAISAHELASVAVKVVPTAGCERCGARLVPCGY